MKSLVKKASVVVLAAGMVLPVMSMAADSGKDLYDSKCKMCHGADGEKTATPLNADAQKKSDADLKATIEKGKPPKMPAYGTKLSGEQIDALVKYIRTLKK